MPDWLYSIDLSIFRWANESIANAPFDWFFPFITDIGNWYLVYVLSLLSLVVFGRKKGIIVVVLLLLTITISDQLSSSVIKQWVGRVRPCSDLEHVRLLINCGSGNSFPSSHAVNNFAAAFLIGMFYRKSLPYLLVTASLVAFSRVYVGVHYPLDILAGSMLGSAIALSIVALYMRLARTFPVLQLSGKKGAA